MDEQASGVRRVGAQRDYPLSFVQREIWFQCQLQADAPHYRLAFVSTITGPLDRALFVRALQAVVDRQSVLRTAFHAPDGVPRQFIVPRVDAESPYEDLSGEHLFSLDETALRNRVYERFFKIASDPFELGRAPLWRAVLLRVDGRQHWLFFLFHHLIMDGHHAGALVGEIGATYWRYVQGDDQSPAPLPLEYRDFAVWLDERQRTRTLDAHESYWLDRLRAPSADALLPRDRLAPLCRRYTSDGLWRQLDPSLAEGLTPLGRTCRATPYRLIVAAFAIVLARFTAARAVAVGQPFSTRPPELQEVAGQYANTLPVRIRVDPRQRFRDFARAVSRELDDARQRRDSSIVDAFRQTGGDWTHVAPLRFGVSQLAHLDLQLPGFRIEQRPSVFSAAQRYDLWLGVKEMSSAISLTFGYAAELFERDTMERFATYLLTLLADASRNPDRTIGELEMTSASDCRALVERFEKRNGTARTDQNDGCVHERFERRARLTPETPALSFGSTALSYGELDAKANRLAHWLSARGVGADTRVPLLLDPSVETIVAMLAVLKAGGAYVPIEPGTPPLRLRELLDAVGGPVILTERSLAGELHAAGDVAGDVLCLDDEWAAVAGMPASPPDRVATGAGAAIVNFTADATGTPTGIVVPHRAVVSGVLEPLLGAGDTILQLSPYGADAAAFEIWGALLNGARLVLVPRSTVLDPDALAGVLRTERVTVLSLTTTVFNRLLDTQADALAGLKTLLVRGEHASVPHFRRAAERLTETRVIRAYGPAGHSVFSTWQLVDRVAADALTIRAGHPVGSSTAYVLDEDLRPVPIKVKGALFLGGDGLARGYLNRPDATAERFVPNPFAAGERLYRTGDFARWHADGSLELIAGHDTTAAARGDRFDAEIEGGPAPAQPETDTERQIVTVWREVLGTPRVGIYDDFFEIGGDSIAWVRIVARLRTRGLPLKERDLVSHRTVAALAASIDQRALVAAAPAVVDRGAAAAVDEDELVALLGSEGDA